LIRFSRNDVRLPQPEFRSDAKEIKARPSRELLSSSELEDMAEIQFRVSPAIAVLILGLLAVPLAHTAPREGRGGRIILGMLAYVVYANVLYLDRYWIAKGIVPPSLGIWWVHLLVLTIALVWLGRQGRFHRRALP
jgi:lipopolysaccharide export system permease protein